MVGTPNPGPRNWEYRVEPKEIHYLKFVLEAYDNLATMSTIDADGGLVRITVPPGREKEAAELLRVLALEVGAELATPEPSPAPVDEAAILRPVESKGRGSWEPRGRSDGCDTR